MCGPLNLPPQHYLHFALLVSQSFLIFFFFGPHDLGDQTQSPMDARQTSAVLPCYISSPILIIFYSVEQDFDGSL